MRGTGTVAGVLVTGTAALSTLALTVTVCALFLRGDADAGERLVPHALGALAATLALLARTRPDPVAEPVEVTASDPLPVVEQGHG